MKFAGWITACVAHYRCQRYVRRAVESLLNQSYPWVRIIVINDGDPVTPWRELANVTDPRLLRFDLKVNRGCFFCWEIARRATPDPYFMMQDADDWAAPDRAATLLTIMRDEKSDLAVSAQPQFGETAQGTPHQVAIRWDRISDEESAPPFTVNRHLNKDFVYRVPHHGLIRTIALRRIGGYYGGFRIGWDKLLTNLILMTASISWTPEPLYYRLVRSDSLTHSRHTGARSEYASAVNSCLEALYRDCFEGYSRYLSGDIPYNTLAALIRKISQRYVPKVEQLALTSQADRLHRKLS
jgi:glycosyltransferase involved in cell wall biosynthesis